MAEPKSDYVKGDKQHYQGESCRSCAMVRRITSRDLHLGNGLRSRTAMILVIYGFILLIRSSAGLEENMDSISRDATLHRNHSDQTTISLLQLMEEDTTQSASNESQETTISWLQFMENDANQWSDDSHLSNPEHIRLRRNVDSEGSGSGIGDFTTEPMTTAIDDTTTAVDTTTVEDGTTPETGSGIDDTTSYTTDTPTTVPTDTTGTNAPDTTETTEAVDTTDTVTSNPTTSQTDTETTSLFTATTDDFTSSGFEETTFFTTDNPTATSTFVDTSVTSEITVTTEVINTTLTATSNTATSETIAITQTTVFETETTSLVTDTTDLATATGSGSEDTTFFTTENPVSDETNMTTTVALANGTTVTSQSTATTQSDSGTNATTQATTESSCITTPCPENSFCGDDEITCLCNLGYYEDTNGICVAGKFFGGILHMVETFNDSLNNASSDHYKETVARVTTFLEDCYSGNSWFVSVNILQFRAGSVLVDHEIVTTEDATSNNVSEAFDTYLSNTAVFPTNCSCESSSCNSTLEVDIFPNESCRDAGTQTALVCDSTAGQQYCKDNADCTATIDGEVDCECNGDTVFESNLNTTCIAIVCTSASGCNQPFGSCRTNTPQGICDCMWGFEGENCQTYWLFVLVITLSGVVLIAIVVVVVVCCKRTRRSKTYESNPYSNSGALSISLDRFKTMSEWDERIGTVVPTSYKRTADGEGYDSAYDRSSASADYDHLHQNPDDRGITLRNWRVSELGAGDRSSYETTGSDEGLGGQPVHLGTFHENGANVTMEQTKI